jgi:hypothetical protein
MYQHLSLQDAPKFTQIGIFGLKKVTIWQPWREGAEREIVEKIEWPFFAARGKRAFDGHGSYLAPKSLLLTPSYEEPDLLLMNGQGCYRRYTQKNKK